MKKLSFVFSLLFVAMQSSAAAEMVDPAILANDLVAGKEQQETYVLADDLEDTQAQAIVDQVRNKIMTDPTLRKGIRSMLQEEMAYVQKSMATVRQPQAAAEAVQAHDAYQLVMENAKMRMNAKLVDMIENVGKDKDNKKEDKDKDKKSEPGVLEKMFKPTIDFTIDLVSKQLMPAFVGFLAISTGTIAAVRYTPGVLKFMLELIFTAGTGDSDQCANPNYKTDNSLWCKYFPSACVVPTA